jgi:putative PIG3 family NAD(P)H quinone oxidoreductase
MMQFIKTTAFGNPEVLQLQNCDPPSPAAGEVLIRVAAAGVNRPDVFQRQGMYPPPPGASPILGLEVAGEVAAVGEGVNGWSSGDKVCALTNGGGYAEYVTVPATQCLPIPENLDFVGAAALPETCFTVWSNVFDRAGLRAGETFLVHGGGSGIGTTAIQMARAFGARVFTTAGRDDKCRVCETIGAEIALNYHDHDFVAVFKKATAKKGVDVILDMVGGDYIPRNIKLAAMDGRIVNIAYLKGAKVETNFMPVMLKRLTITGSTLRPRSAEVKGGIAKKLKKEVWPLLSSGAIKPVIAETFPLAEAAAAHRLMESNAHIGKIVLIVSG